jgi:acyl-CoA synthetase (AMP-forming)/AMP-acid ligase II
LTRGHGAAGAPPTSPVRTLRDVLDRHAATRPDAPFLFAPEADAVITYCELRVSSNAIAGLLSGSGVAPGEVVSFMLPNGASAATIFLGAMAAGYVVSPLNLLSQDTHLAHTLAHSGTRFIFAAPEFIERITRLLGSAALRVTVHPTDPDALRLDSQRPCPPPDLDAQTPALLMYTSGTTGLPKGALLSHGNLVHAARAVADAHQLTDGDRVLSSLPLYHVNGQCIATIAPVLAGGSIVLPRRFSASQWWPLVERYRPTWLNMVPTIISYLLNGADLTPAQAEACRAIRFGRSASSPLPPDHHRAFESRFGVSVIEAMGLTECASVAFANPLDPAQRKYGTPGRPLGLEARVVAPDGRVLGNGVSGEIQLRGANVMLGYYKAPELTAAALDADGWLATGDLGYRDDDGFYFITGRLKELIIKGGENIGPREIDEALLRHPAVLEAAAVGIPDRHYGQEILACVVLRAGMQCTVEDLHAHCVRELGPYKTPKILRLVDDLPKGASGKVQRLKLLDVA